MSLKFVKKRNFLEINLWKFYNNIGIKNEEKDIYG